jgi:2-dehydropantoate 2-reductase
VRLAVIGAGAVGAVTAAAAAGHDVTVCARTPISSLTLSCAEGSPFPAGALPVRLVSAPGVFAGAPVDVVFVTVKATDVGSCRPWLEALCAPSTLVVAVQNGLDHAGRFAGLVPAGTEVVPGLAYLAAERLGPGSVRHLSGSLLIVPSASAGAVGRALPLMKVRGREDMVTACWQKLLGNLVANPLTALTMRRIEVIGEPGMADLARGLLREAVAVGRAEGAEISEDDIEPMVAGTAQYGSETGSSMLYDRLAGRPTEHQFLTGEIVRRGAAHGIDVPLSAAVLALLEAIDRGRS